MDTSDDALFYLNSHNEVDQIVPILYRIGERNNITADVVLRGSVDTHDYRISAINQFDNITVVDQTDTESKITTTDTVIELIKNAGRKIPSELPERVYRTLFKSQQVSVPNKLSDNNYSVIAFDWTYAKGQRTTHFARDDDIVTIVLPHGDSPFANRLSNETAFDRFIRNGSNCSSKKEINKIEYQSYSEFLKHDYLLFPNERTAIRVPESSSHDKIRIYGSPRYNSEWLRVLSQIRPDENTTRNAELNVTFFLRRGDYFISETEVLYTLQMLNQFDDIETIVKEHPRDRLLSPSAASDMDNVNIVKDEISSASLIDWGDIFLSLGTTITFEPVMRNKPVLAVEYAHANHTVISSYFSEADMRSKEDLYFALHDFLSTGTSDFYNDLAYQQFVTETVSPVEDSVLDTWAEFIESQATKQVNG